MAEPESPSDDRRTRARGNRIRAWLAPALVALGATLLHCPTIAYELTFDDRPIILEQADLRDLGMWREVISRDWWGNLAYDRLWRPLTLLSFAAQGAWTGADPRYLHLGNVLFSAAVALLLYALARVLGLGRLPAAGAAIVYTALAVHVEPVTNIVGRADLLATTFVLAALLCHDRRGVLAAGLAALLFALGLLSKESAVAFPALALALDVVARGRRPRWRLLCYLGVLAAYLALRFAVLGSLTRPVDATLRFDNPLAVAGIVPRLLTAIAVLGRYAAALVWPVGLSPNYGFDEIPIVRQALDPWLLLGLATHGGMLALAGVLAWRRRAPVVAFGLFFYLLALFPVSNLLLLIGTIRADRLLYLPSAGLALALGRAGAGVGGRRAAGLAICALVAAYQAGFTVQRLPEWRDDLTLLAAASRAAPRSVVVRSMHARAWLRAGDLLAAERELQAAVAIAPDAIRSLHELGIVQLRLGRPDDAEATFERAIRAEPLDHIGWNFVGSIRYQRGDAAGALVAFTRAVEVRPGYALGHANRGRVLLEAGREGEALAAFSAASAADPGLVPPLVGAALVQARRGERARALALLDRALALDPSSAEVRSLRQRLGAAAAPR